MIEIYCSVEYAGRVQSAADDDQVVSGAVIRAARGVFLDPPAEFTENDNKGIIQFVQKGVPENAVFIEQLKLLQ